MSCKIKRARPTSKLPGILVGMVLCCCIIETNATAQITGQSSSGTEYRENGQLVCTGVMARMFNGDLIKRVTQSWESVGAETRSCVVRRTKTSVDQLIGQCIDPADNRVSRYVDTCRKEVEEARLAREAEERRRAAAQATRERAEARRQALIAQYGKNIATTILAGEVVNGMTAEQVVASVGKPQSKETIPPNFELWSYRDKRIALRDGQVSHVDQ